MIESVLKLIGVTDELTSHLDQVELDFQRWQVLWGGLLLLLPVGWFIYVRQRDNLSTVPKKFRVALSVTRILILLMLIAVLAGPFLRYDQTIEKKPIVAFLFDLSQSMQLAAGPFESNDEVLGVAKAAGYDVRDGKLDSEARRALNRIGRGELAQSVLRAAADSLIAPLKEKHEVRFYVFARELSRITFDPAAAEPVSLTTRDGGTSSHIGEAIHAVLDEAAGQPIAGIVLLTDGQNTGGRSPLQAARAAADAKAPIFTTPLGSAERVQDVSVIDVYTSGLVAVGDTARVNVTIESQGFDKRPVKVELAHGEKLLDTKEAVLDSGTHQQVELTFKAEGPPGSRQLTVRVPPLKEELQREELTKNNQDVAIVRITEGRIKVLFVDGLARWDFRFVKNAIRRDQGLAGRTGAVPDVVLEAEYRRWTAKQQADALPRTLEQFAEYDTIILGDASPAILTPEFQKLLIEAVQKKGVGLIVAAGTQSMPHRYDQAFRELLPVQVVEGTAGNEAPEFSKGFQMEVTPAGVIHETMRLYDDPGRNQNVWSFMPAYYWCAAVGRAAAAAEVLAWNSSIENNYGKMPLIAWHYAGEGKVMFVGTDSTWLWRQNVGDRFFYKFWGQSIRFLARRDEDAAKKSYLVVRPLRAQPGEEAEVELMAFDVDGSPTKAERLAAAVLGTDSREQVELVADPAKPGRFTGRFRPTKPGEHRVTYGDGAEPVEATIRVLVAPEEFRHPNLNRPMLELLAGTTGGAVVPLAELATIPAKLAKADASTRDVHRTASIWDNWLALLVLTLVYSTDVAIRRLMGLS